MINSIFVLLSFAHIDLNKWIQCVKKKKKKNQCLIEQHFQTPTLPFAKNNIVFHLRTLLLPKG